MNNIVPGSLSAIAHDQHTSVAESFISADAIILCDVSGSMSIQDARGNRRRYDVLLEELTKLQAKLPGKLAIVAFSSGVDFCPGGIPFYDGGGTALDKALSFVRVADGTVTFTVISDGYPNDPDKCLRFASSFKSRIDTVYCGPEGGEGQEFLRKLALCGNGQSVTSDRVHQLAQTVERLLLSA